MIKENYLYKIIKGQHLSEKTTRISETSRCITFNVLKDANKHQIKNAVEKIFNVKISNVNTLNVKGKKTKFKNIIGKKSDFKKAIITLKKGYEINFTEFE